MGNEKQNKVIDLESGRKVGYAEYCEPKGFPILYFHGFPGSRLNPIMLKAGEISEKVGVRLIAIDRPGVGLSTFKKKELYLISPLISKFMENEGHLSLPYKNFQKILSQLK